MNCRVLIFPISVVFGVCTALHARMFDASIQNFILLVRVNPRVSPGIFRLPCPSKSNLSLILSTYSLGSDRASVAIRVFPLSPRG